MSELSRSKRKVSTGEDLTPEEKARLTIQTARKQLDVAIEQLDSKIQRRIEANECKFLIAYKNSMDKITRELKVLKQTYDVHEKKFESDKAIVALGKQCTLFRQQAMRLHNQLEDAIAQLDIYKRKSQILESQITNTNDLLKKSMHSNKLLQAERLRLILQISRKEKQTPPTNIKLKFEQKLNKSENTQKVSMEETSKIIQQAKGVKNVEVEPPHVNIKDWLNKTGSIRIQSPRTQRNRESEFNYKVFEKEGMYDRSWLTPKNRSVKGAHRRRNLTCSTIQYQSSFRQQNSHHPDYNSSKYRKSSQKLQEFECNQNGTNQEQVFNKFLYSLKNARAQSLNNSSQTTYILKSNNINQLIVNDHDMIELCRKLFPNLNISNSFEVNYQNAETMKKKIKMKTLTQLSAQLMQKFDIEKMGKIEKIKTQNNLHLSCQELQYISKNKVNLKTQPSEKDNQIQRLAVQRANKLRKMNESFKRKTLPSQSVLSTFYLSARQRKKQ